MIAVLLSILAQSPQEPPQSGEAQKPPAATGAPQAEVVQPRPRSDAGNIWDNALIIAILTSVVGPLVVYYFTDKRRLSEIRNLRRGITQPQPAADDGRRSSIMVFGIGGAGKTSFIENMFARGATTTEKTEHVWFYEYRDEVKAPRTDGNRTKAAESFTHYVSDYKGQNLGTIVQSFILQQKKLFSPMAYGYITAAVFVVDIFETDRDGLPVAGFNGQVPLPLADRSQPHHARVEANRRAWNDQSLDAVFGLITSDNLRCVVLFINKMNGLSPRTDKSTNAARSAYAWLEDGIRRRAPGRDVIVVAGSAGQSATDGSPGEGLPIIMGQIRKAADEPGGVW